MKINLTDKGKRGGKGYMKVEDVLNKPTYFVIRISGVEKGKPAFNCQTYSDKINGLENYVSSSSRKTIDEILAFIDSLKPVTMAKK